MTEPKREILVQLGGAGRISRRQAVQWVFAAAAASALPTGASARPVDLAPAPLDNGVSQYLPTAGGYGTDPRLAAIHHPGDLWPLTFTAAQRETVKSLADVILPSDQFGPAASEVGVVDMLDEWISAPYPQQKHDRPIILDGLVWLAAESQQRFTRDFAGLSADQKHALCDDVCFAAAVKPQFHKAATFFARFRSLCAAAYYATPAGWKAIGYVGNVALPSFDGPPPEVLEKLGVTQTVT